MDIKVLAWHIPAKGLKLAYDDNRRIKVGGTLSVRGTPILCTNGLHGSVQLRDAFSYGDGDATHVTRVEIWGNIHQCSDKLCGSHRKCLGRISMRDVEWISAKYVAEQMAPHLPYMDGVLAEFAEMVNSLEKRPPFGHELWPTVRHIIHRYRGTLPHTPAGYTAYRMARCLMPAQYAHELRHLVVSAVDMSSLVDVGSTYLHIEQRLLGAMGL